MADRHRAQPGAKTVESKSPTDRPPEVELPIAQWPKLVARERLRLLHRALDTLSDDAREVAALVLVQGMSYAECAELLDMPFNTVASHVSRSRKRLLSFVQEADAASKGAYDD